MKFRLKTIEKIYNTINSKFQKEFESLETLQLLTYVKPIFWSWGVDTEKIIRFSKGGFFFPVNGYLHKGFVLITLAYNDTYTVTLYNKKLIEKKQIEEVYFDQLVEVIDTNVERKK